MPSEIDGDWAVFLREIGQLRFEISETTHYAVEKDDRVALTVIFVIEVCPVTLDIRHSTECTWHSSISLRHRSTKRGDPASLPDRIFD